MSTITTRNPARRVLTAALALAGVLLAALLLAAGPAHAAAFSVKSFDGGVWDQNGNAFTQAGGHPYSASTTIMFPSHVDSQGQLRADANIKDVHVNLPPGLVGDPQATPKCPQAGVGHVTSPPSCPASSQVGVAVTYLEFSSGPPLSTPWVTLSPIYNVDPPKGVPAEFAWQIGPVIALADAVVRTGGDYGLSIDVDNISAGEGVIGTKVTFWGVPADPVHDAQRFCTGGSAVPLDQCTAATSAPLKPFLTLPTSCLGPQTTTMAVDTWQDPGDWKTASFVSHDENGTPIGATGCGLLHFRPTISVQPTTRAADSPTGLKVDLHVPQNDDVGGLAESNLKQAKVVLPAGMSVSPAAADGLSGCSEAQIGLHSAAPATCPESSKIGSVKVTTPLLPDKLTGGVYLAQQGNLPGHGSNPFNSLLAIYLTVHGDGVWVKLAGHVVADPVTGQLTTTFSDNPQLPFSDFQLDFFGGPRAPLVSPSACGTYTTRSALSSWSGGSAVVSGDSFTIDQNCGASKGFSPSLQAGVENPAAGGSSPFRLTLSRDSGENLEAVDTVLPKGLLAALKGVPLCPDSAAAGGACPAASQIGHVTAASGPGSEPLYIPQAGKAPTAVYLAGPYKGGPYSLVIKVPAQAGPFDLGTVVVRAALYVDPETAQVTVKSDPMPQILQGIPLEYRKLVVSVDRKDFMRSPTNCSPMKVRADVHGAPLGGPVKVSPGGLGIAAAADAIAHLSNHFQVGGCGSLPFKPRMGMRLNGKHQRRDGGHPALITNVREPEHQANIRAVRVALPLSLALDPRNSQHVCDYDKAKAVHGTKAPCSKRTIVGKAVAKTPLLPHKLRAHVYLVQGIRFNKEGERIKTLPTLLVPLRGKDHVAIDLRAKTNVSHKKLVTTFRGVPDAQISSFKLRINGGKRGILVVTHNQNICRGRQVTDTSYKGQSGKRYDQRVHMKAPCKGVKKARRARLRQRIHRLRRAVHRAARHGHKARARKAIRRIHHLRHAR